MILATLWLNIHQGTPWPNSPRELWVKDVTYLPMPGDEIVLYGTDEEPTDGGPTWPQKRRYWTTDGKLNVELASIVVDPTPEALSTMLADRYAEKPWYTQTDGQPADQLIGQSWVPYLPGRRRG
jgi:hypothetical protein